MNEVKELMEEKELIIVDEDGTEYRFEILFTYESEDRNQSYVLFYDLAKPDDILVARYLENGSIDTDLTDEEYAEAEEILNTFNNDPALK